MLALSPSGKEAIIEFVGDTKFIFTDVETGTECNLTYNSSDWTLNIDRECDLEWTQTFFVDFDDSGEPMGIIGPGDEIYLLQFDDYEGDDE